MSAISFFMQRALQLAQQGQYTTRPNPCVGCVIVKNGQTIGEGFHQQAGTPHAEIHALAQAGVNAKGATVYVTLEPCSHYGRTGPCCEALIQAGVAKVVVAMQDPNPKVNGQGIARLRQAGIAVEIGDGQAEALALNEGFIYHMQHQKPWVRSKLGMSLDGRIAMASGESQWITTEASRFDVQLLRARSGAIITGIGTVLADDPQLTVRVATWPAAMRPAILIPQPLCVIVDSQLRIPLSAKILQSPEYTWVICAVPQPEKLAALTAMGVRVEVLSTRENQVDLSATLALLAAAQIHDVLVEAGGHLTGSFIEQNLVNELWLYVAPKLLGADAQGAFQLPHLQQLKDAPSFKVRSLVPMGSDYRWVLAPGF